MIELILTCIIVRHVILCCRHINSVSYLSLQLYVLLSPLQTHVRLRHFSHGQHRITVRFQATPHSTLCPPDLPARCDLTVSTFHDRIGLVAHPMVTGRDMTMASAFHTCQINPSVSPTLIINPLAATFPRSREV